MTNDLISDLIARINNGYNASLREISVPWTKNSERITEILVKNRYLDEMSIVGETTMKKIIIKLLYQNGAPVVNKIKRISKSSRRVYVNKDKIMPVMGGMGLAIISTPKGVMTHKDAKKNGVGGEVWCQVW